MLSGDSYIRFDDREDAGQQLAERIQAESVNVDIVLAIPRGGLPVGRVVADALGVPLDIVVTSKIGAPHNPEFAIGAAASDGSVWVNQEAVDRLEVSDAYLMGEQDREIALAKEKAGTYRGERPEPVLEGKSVLIVDDGAATGATAIAAVNLVRARGAGEVSVGIPVGPPDTIAELESLADVVIYVSAPASFSAVGQFYTDFEQVSDEEAQALLQDT